MYRSTLVSSGLFPASGAASDTPTGTLPATHTATSTATDTPTSTPTNTSTSTSMPTDTPTSTATTIPEFTFTDPCQVGCNLPEATSRLCNTSDSNYLGDIEWSATFKGQAYPSNVMSPSSPIQGLAANSCVDLSVPRVGDGVYAFNVNIVELEITLTAGCSLVCIRTNITATPVEPPPGGDGDVLIPVTGIDFLGDGGVMMQRNFQNLGFGFLSLGLVLHGIVMRKKSEEDSE